MTQSYRWQQGVSIAYTENVVVLRGDNVANQIYNLCEDAGLSSGYGAIEA